MAVGHPHAGGHRALVHIQAGAALDQRLISSPPPGTPASGRHPEEPLPGESQSRARGNSAGCPRLHVRLISGLAAPSSTNVGRMTGPFLIRRGWPSTAIRVIRDQRLSAVLSSLWLVVRLHKFYKD